MTITAAPPTPPPARRSSREPERRSGVSRIVRLRTVPGRIRAIAFVAVLAVVAVFAVAALAVQDARDGLRVIGHDAGPQVVATGDLYYALSDMDAQLTAILLMGQEQNLGIGKARAQQLYDQDRSLADKALLQGATLAGDDSAEQQTARSMLDALGRYETVAGQALQLNGQRRHVAGPPDAAVIKLYRDAANIMKLEILPQAYNLTLDNGTTVRRTYESERSSVLARRVWVGILGLVLVLVLAGLQLYLTVNFRRVINPVLAVATVGTIVIIAVTVGLLSSEAGHLKQAKEDGFDSVLSLSRARAISNSANADETRFLLDPGLADTYEQVYLDKSQEIVYVQAASLGAYYSALDQGVSRRSGFLGFFGAEAGHITLPGQRAALDTTLAAYQQVQHNDRQIRALAANPTSRHDAIVTRTGTSAQDFQRYDQALGALTAIHEKAFESAIGDGDHGLRGWNVLLPVAAVVIVALILVGVRPRLSEFR